jgi:hypothetical protein
MLLTDFVFISVVSFHCFGLPWLPTLGSISGRSLRYSVGFGRALRGKMRTTDCADDADITNEEAIAVASAPR